MTSSQDTEGASAADDNRAARRPRMVALTRSAIVLLSLVTLAGCNGCGKNRLANLPAPVILACTPERGVVGTVVTCTGNYLLNPIAVTFNGVSATQFSGDAQGIQFTATVPVSATTGLIHLTTDHGTADSPAPFVVIGPPAQLAFVQQPSDAGSGVPFNPAVSVAVEDDAGYIVPNATNEISLTSNAGTLSQAGMDGGTVDGGVTTFNALALNAIADGGYILTATSPSGNIAPAKSAPFSIDTGPAYQLVFVQQPTDLRSGDPFSPTVSVAVVDSGRNIVPTGTIQISLGLSPNTGLLAQTNGQSPVIVNTLSGVATFTGVTATAIANSGYTLTATAVGTTLLEATSQPFAIAPGEPTQLFFSGPPSDTQSGHGMVPIVVVSIEDSAGNIVPTSNTITLTPEPHFLGGTVLPSLNNVEAPVNNSGIASFPGLTLAGTVGQYTLIATSGPLTGTSTPFAITAGDAAQFSFSVEPANSASGQVVGGPVTIVAEDTAGNLATSFTDSVTVALASNSPMGTLSNTSATSVSGRATFDTLSLVAQPASNYALVAFAPTNSAIPEANSTTFAISAGTATQLVFIVPPPQWPNTVQSGVAIGNPAVAVQFEDASGNPVYYNGSSVVLTLTSAAGTAQSTGSLITPTIGCGASCLSAGGVATFNGLTVSALAGTYTLTATAMINGNPLTVTSMQFTVVPGLASKLAFAPATTLNAHSGIAMGQLAVNVEDFAGNVVTTSTAAVTLSAPPGSISGASASATSGVARLNPTLTGSASASPYTLIAASSGLTSATRQVNLSYGNASRLAIISTTPISAQSGLSMPTVTVAVEDSANNIVSSPSYQISLAVSGAIAFAGGAAQATDNSGTASFNPTLTGLVSLSPFTLTASSSATNPSLTPATAQINLSAGAPLQLAFAEATTLNARSGIAMGPLAVNVEDSAGNVVTTSSAAITLSAPPGSVSSASASATSGVATLNPTLTGSASASPYTLIAASSGLTSATRQVNLSYGNASKLAITSTTPISAQSGLSMPAVNVAVEDSANNIVSSPSYQISLAVSGATAFTGGDISGTDSHGIATFLTPTLTGLVANSPFTLTASSSATNPSLTPATAQINLSAGTPSQLAFAPATMLSEHSGIAMAQVKVDVEDSAGNVVTTSSAAITLSANAGALTGTSASATNGVASLNPTLTGSASASPYTLTAASSGLTSATRQVTLSYGNASKLAITSSTPISAQSGLPMPAVTVAVEDSANNIVSSPSYQISLAVSGAIAFAGGAAQATDNSGTASFNPTLTGLVTLSPFTLTATSSATNPSLTPATAQINLSAGTPSQLGVTIQPATPTAGVAFTVTVAVEDASGNVVTNSPPAVTIMLGQNGGAGILSGTGSPSVNAGITTFANVILDRSGCGYSINAATASPLLSGTSPLFDVAPGPLATNGTTGVLTQGSSGDYTCAVANGGAWCWGDNSQGQLGNNTTVSCSLPVHVVGLPAGVQSIAAGYEHTCAVANGDVFCWGAGISGGLGNSSFTGSNVAVPVSGIAGGASSVSAGGAGNSSTCAIINGGVQCWGAFDDGGTASAHSGYIEADALVPQGIAGLGSGVQAIAVGGTHSCALINGGVECWGDNTYDALGSNNDAANGSAWSSSTPVPVYGLSAGVQAITSGADQSCALVNGGVQCWGYNADGELGDNFTTPSLIPVPVGGLSGGVQAIAAGGHQTCALINGGVQCWGSSASGQLGTGAILSVCGMDIHPCSLVPVSVPGMTSGVQAISGGDSSVCALVNDGVQCWGDNSFGELGNHSDAGSPTPVQAQSITRGIAGMSLGSKGTCAMVNGGVKCWGYGADGELGNGAVAGSATAVQVQGLASGVQSIVSNLDHTCALVGGGVWCWGGNKYGNTIVGETAPIDAGMSDVPHPIPGLGSGVQAIATGAYDSCAIVNGAIDCWGYNSGYGLLGTGVSGTIVGSSSPALINGLDAGAQAVAVGGFQACALVNGGVDCWGGNASGQLGYNSPSYASSTPHPVAGLDAGVQAIATEGETSCALANGGVYCWGSNIYGQLGNNSIYVNPFDGGSTYPGNYNLNVPAPSQVYPADAGVSAIAAGVAFACALINGGVQCWGENESGELGIPLDAGVANCSGSPCSPVPVSVTNLGPGAGVQAIYAGSAHACALVNGQLFCWGANQSNELGNNGATNNGYSAIPVPVNALTY